MCQLHRRQYRTLYAFKVFQLIFLLGSGGVSAFVGFNGGNGTRSYEYAPYSQQSVIRDLTGTGWGNGLQGRHIFRIDEKILLGSCNKDIGKYI